jgi:hypothetical protein
MPDHDWFDGDLGCNYPQDDPVKVRAYAYLAVSSVPKHTVIPDDFVEQRSARDDQHAAIVLEKYPGDPDALVLVWTKQRAWLRYWAVNHPTAEGRAACVEALKEGNGLIERARDHLRRQGLDPLSGEPMEAKDV